MKAKMRKRNYGYVPKFKLPKRISDEDKYP